MLDLTRALNEDRLLRALTGLNKKSFQHLEQTIADLLKAAPATARQRAPGAGRKHTLASPVEKLFFVLFYFKCYPTYDLAGWLFAVNRSNACRWIAQLQPLVEKALQTKLCLPERKLDSLEQFTRLMPAVRSLLVDGVERPVQRPKQARQQKEVYSGKKKRHTHKHLIAATADKRIRVLCAPQPGRVHDRKMEQQQELVHCVPGEIPIEVDLGFKGLDGDYVNIIIPEKKKKNQPLSEEQKAANKSKAASRVKVEHAISGMKRYKAGADILRNRKVEIVNSIMITAAGLWNFYLVFS